MSNEATLGAGTKVRFSTNLQTPTYTVIPGVISIGAIGLNTESKPSTVLSDTIKQFRPGMKEGPDKNFKGQYFDSNPKQVAFKTACQNLQKMLIQVELPNKPDPTAAGTGTIFEFEWQPFGWEVDEPQAEEWLMFTANGKQLTEPAETAPTTL